MQFTTIGFNQKMAVDNDLDQSDLNILNWIMTFSLSSKMVTYHKDGKTFLWVQYQAIIEDLPIMKINSKRIIAKRLDILVEKGFLDKEVQKNNGNYTYFAILDKTIEMKFNRENTLPMYSKEHTLCTQKNIPYAPKSAYPMYSKVHTKDSNTNNYNTNNYNTNIKEKINKKEKSGVATPKENLSFDFADFTKTEIEAINEWLEYKTQAKKGYKTQIGLNKLRKQLLDFKKQYDITQIIDISIANNWVGLFAPKQNTQANSNTHDTFKNVERTGPIVVTDW